jgi:hypothetical protein
MTPLEQALKLMNEFFQKETPSSKIILVKRK